VIDRSLSWCEFGVGQGETLDWFALHKPRQNVLFGFDTFRGLPEPWLIYPAGHWRSADYVSHREDVVIVKGRFEETLSDEKVCRRLGSQIGLVHVDCDLYSSTQAVFTKIGRLIGAGTLIIFDEFCGYPGWEEGEAKAFWEFVGQAGVDFEYVARADYQVLVRVLGTGRRARWTIRNVAYRSGAPGVAVEPPRPPRPGFRALPATLRRRLTRPTGPGGSRAARNLTAWPDPAVSSILRKL
jgi:hypothetical protein